MALQSHCFGAHGHTNPCNLRHGSTRSTCEFLRAALAGDHKTLGLKQRLLFRFWRPDVQNPGVPEPRSLGGSGEDPPCLCQLPGAPGLLGLWLYHFRLRLFPHPASLCILAPLLSGYLLDLEPTLI